MNQRDPTDRADARLIPPIRCYRRDIDSMRFCVVQARRQATLFPAYLVDFTIEGNAVRVIDAIVEKHPPA